MKTVPITTFQLAKFLLNPTKSRFWIFTFFLVSGATGIIYEVVWTRLLTMVIGNTHFSITTVLTAFMGGLALGSYFGGKYIDHSRKPLLVYAVLEGGIGLYCLLVPFLIQGAFPLFKWAYSTFGDTYLLATFFRFSISGVILLIPTTMMGATLPVLSKVVSRNEAFIGKDVGTLYAINTFGAVLGALSSAFILMRYFGVSTTIHIAAFINVAIAVAVFVLYGKDSVEASIQTSEEGNTKSEPDGQLFVFGSDRIILICFGISGLAALTYQVSWNRILSLVLGSSIYAFSLILTTFILGLAFGTVSFSKIVNRFKDLLKTFGVLQIAIGVSALVALPFFGKIPMVNRWIFEEGGVGFNAVQGANFLIIFSLLFLPTFFMGAQFPVVVKYIARHLNTLGEHVGKVYAYNTVGTILGSFLGGFVFIPWLGLQNTVALSIGINMLLGAVILFRSQSVSQNLKYYGLPLLLAGSVWATQALPQWDKAVISSGSFMPYRLEDLDQAVRKTNKILFYKEGIHTTVTTELALSGNIFLRVNGKTDASLALDMRTQLLSGYLPMLFHENPKSALVVGQGSGITLGAVQQFPVESIDLVEISKAVIDGSRFFGPFNHHSIEDKRVRLVLEDGRNHIALTDKTYDVIISEPSNPWISGVGALFTQKFFEMARERLNPGGVLCIWVHTNMSPQSFKSITRTFHSVFPHVSMWESIVGDDYLLIGSRETQKLSYKRVEDFLKHHPSRGDLKKIGVNSVRDLISLMIMTESQLQQFSKDVPIHTDDNSLLEFQAPEYIYKDERDVIVRQIDPFVKIDLERLKFDGLRSKELETVKAGLAGIERSESQIAEIKRQARIDVLLDGALEAFQNGRYAQSIEQYNKILLLDPEHILTLTNLGNVYTATQLYDRAEESYKATIELNPYYLFGYINLAKLYLSTGKAGKAEALLKGVTDWHSLDSEVHLYLGLAYSFQKQTDKAIRQWHQALNLDSEYAPAYYYLGIQYRNKNSGKSKQYLKTFLTLAEKRELDPALIKNAENIIKKL